MQSFRYRLAWDVALALWQAQAQPPQLLAAQAVVVAGQVAPATAPALPPAPAVASAEPSLDWRASSVWALTDERAHFALRPSQRRWLPIQMAEELCSCSIGSSEQS